MSLANLTFPTRKQAEQLIADAMIGAFYEPRLINGEWHIMPIEPKPQASESH